MTRTLLAAIVAAVLFPAALITLFAAMGDGKQPGDDAAARCELYNPL